MINIRIGKEWAHAKNRDVIPDFAQTRACVLVVGANLPESCEAIASVNQV